MVEEADPERPLALSSDAPSDAPPATSAAIPFATPADTPIERLLETLRRDLLLRRAESAARVERVVAAAQAYLTAVESDLAAELAVKLGLARPEPSKVPAAALALRAAALSLPELAEFEAESEARPLASPASSPAASSPAASSPAASSPPASSPPAPRERELAAREEPRQARETHRIGLDPDVEALAASVATVPLAELPDKLFVTFAEEFAARARLLQQRGLGEADNAAIDRVIKKLTALAHQRTLPRPVYGLKRSHTGDWAAIAKRAVDERDRLEGSGGALTQRLAIPASVKAKVAKREPRDDEDDDDDTDPPLDLPHVRGAAERGELLLVGGGVRPEKLARLRRRTGAAVDWLPLEKGSSAQTVRTLSARIRDGRLSALVLLQGLMTHAEYEGLIAAARQVGLPVVYADKAGKMSLDRAFTELEETFRRRAELAREASPY